MVPPLYTLFRIGPMFSGDILEIAQCIMQNCWGTSTTARLMPHQGTMVFFVRTIHVLVLHTKLSGSTGMGIKQDNRAVVGLPPLSHDMHTMPVPRQVGALLIRHIMHTGFLRLCASGPGPIPFWDSTSACTSTPTPGCFSPRYGTISAGETTPPECRKDLSCGGSRIPGPVPIPLLSPGVTLVA